MKYFLKNSKDRYQTAFNLIIADLPQIIPGIRDVEMIYLVGNIAKYRINRIHDIGGTILPDTDCIRNGFSHSINSLQNFINTCNMQLRVINKKQTNDSHALVIRGTNE